MKRKFERQVDSLNVTDNYFETPRLIVGLVAPVGKSAAVVVDMSDVTDSYFVDRLGSFLMTPLMSMKSAWAANVQKNVPSGLI